MEWIDRRYAEVVEAVKRAAEPVDPRPEGPEPGEPRLARGFVIPRKD